MADVRCSKCGHFAFPTGVFTKEYKKWDGEVVCDSCYSELTREKESLSEQERSAREEAEKAAAEERLKEKEEKEKIGLIYDLNGCRGRSLRVYENKCVFKVSITIGSILTKNATDGEKTIYYSDVIGVQFKPSGLAIGYLQLETASSAGNNKSDNFFNENSFTYEPKNITNDEMEKVVAYIRERVEACKEAKNNPVVAAPAAAVSVADEIKKFKELLDMGAITQEEFDAKKKQLLGL